MSTNRLFRRRKQEAVLQGVPYHPKKDPRYTEPISIRALQDIFANCADFMLREIAPGGKKGVRPGEFCDVVIDGELDGDLLGEAK